MSTETTNKKIKIDNGTTFGKTYTDKAIDERLQGLVSKVNNSLQKPAGLTKTKLVGVGTNGQENIEIGDNLTLANGKLSATGGGSGGDGSSEINIIYLDANSMNITGDYNPDLINICIGDGLFLYSTYSKELSNNVVKTARMDGFAILWGGTFMVSCELNFTTHKAKITSGNKIPIQTYSHFITMTNSSSNIVLYLTIQYTSDTEFTADTLATYLADNKILANGNLHGAVPTYIAGEGGKIKVYYMTSGDSNINPQPDEFADLSSFTITDTLII